MPLFRPKSSTPKRINASRRIGESGAPRGWLPPTAKKTVAATHMGTVSVDMLKSTRETVRSSFAMRDDRTRPSSPAVIAPAAGPNMSAAAMLNVSEIEKLMGIAGMRSVAQLLPIVSATRISH